MYVTYHSDVMTLAQAQGFELVAAGITTDFELEQHETLDPDTGEVLDLDEWCVLIKDIYVVGNVAYLLLRDYQDTLEGA